MGNVFLAVDPSDEERHALAAALSETDLVRVLPGKRTRPPTWHITVRFIGEASDVQVERLAERVEALLDIDPFRVAISGLGAFPRPSKASIVFAAVADPVGGLGEIAVMCDEAAVDVGFEPEGRPFVPHLTLSRVRPVRDVSAIVAGFDEVRIPVDVSAVTMFRTRRTKQGPVHDLLHRFELAASR